MKKSLYLPALFGAVLLAAAPGRAATSGTQSSPSTEGENIEPPQLTFYNDGTRLLFQKQWAPAQRQLEAAVTIDENMAEAHNNLAYVLRKQGESNYARSLEHYNRAIELKPQMAEAYMYRGALFRLSGRIDLARADLATLVAMKSKLAPHLQKIIDTGKEEEPEQFYGVMKQEK